MDKLKSNLTMMLLSIHEQDVYSELIMHYSTRGSTKRGVLRRESKKGEGEGKGKEGSRIALQGTTERERKQATNLLNPVQ
jgi:hypothetical protein